MPHRLICKDSSTTPIHIAFDSSCKSSTDSPSLNDCLHPGSPSVNGCWSILIRFRQHNVAFLSGIENAFLHVYLDDEDRYFTHFWWLSDSYDVSSPLIAFRFWVVLFGATCSPFMLQATLIYSIIWQAIVQVRTSQDILCNLYVDNIVSGCQTEATSLNYFTQSRSILSTANFNVLPWASNSSQLMNIAEWHQVAETNNPIKVLGLWWDISSDLIYSSHKPIVPGTTTTVTKHDVLRWASTIFDLLGLISPVTISAKLFLQTLWQPQIDWDITLSEELDATWRQISNNIQAAAIPFTRQCTSSPPTLETILCIFADASPRAYSAFVFLQQRNNCTLVMSKSRAAPLKNHPLPRLEFLLLVLHGCACLSKHHLTSPPIIYCGLTVKLYCHGCSVRKDWSPLSATEYLRYALFQPHLGIALQLIILLTCLPEVFHMTNYVLPPCGIVDQFGWALHHNGQCGTD